MIESAAQKLGKFLSAYGAPGLFGIAFLDSSFVSLPGINDVLLVYLSSRQPASAPLYALLSLAGSILGGMTLYWLGRTGSGWVVRKKFSRAKLERARPWLDRNGFVSVIVMSLLPPPAPFKLFLLAAGVFRLHVLQFVAGLCVGRSVRFGVVAYLGARYGRAAEAYLRENTGWASAVLIGVALLSYLIYRRFRPASSSE